MKKELSANESALFNRLKDELDIPLLSLTQNEVGCIGHLKSEGLVEVYKNYDDKTKHVRLPLQPTTTDTVSEPISEY